MNIEDYISNKIEEIEKTDKWKTIICNTRHIDIINDFDNDLFKKLTSNFFKEFISKCKCGNNAKCISYKNNVDRCDLIEKCLLENYADIKVPIKLKDLIILYFKEYLNIEYNFVCKKCFLRENKQKPHFILINGYKYIKLKLDEEYKSLLLLISFYKNLNLDELIRNIIKYMKQNKQTFLPDFNQKFKNKWNTYEEYIENIECNNTDILVIKAIQYVLKTKFYICKENNILKDYEINFETSNDPIYILINNNTYNILIKRINILAEKKSDTNNYRLLNLNENLNKQEDYSSSEDISDDVFQEKHESLEKHEQKGYLVDKSTIIRHKKKLSTNNSVLYSKNKCLDNFNDDIKTDNIIKDIEKKIYMKEELQQFKNIEIKQILEFNKFKFNNKDKKSILIRKYLNNVKEIQMKRRNEELSKLTCKDLFKILNERCITYKRNELKHNLIQKIIESE